MGIVLFSNFCFRLLKQITYFWHVFSVVCFYSPSLPFMLRRAVEFGIVSRKHSFWSSSSSIEWWWLSTCLSNSKDKGFVTLCYPSNILFLKNWHTWIHPDLLHNFVLVLRVQTLGIWKVLGFVGIKKLNGTQM